MSAPALAALLSMIMVASVQRADKGVAAYYHQIDIRDVCLTRTAWQDLDCSWPCLVAGIEQDTVGRWWFINVPGASWHL